MGEAIRRFHEELHRNAKTRFYGHRLHLGEIDRRRVGQGKPVGRRHDISLLYNHVRLHSDLFGAVAVLRSSACR